MSTDRLDRERLSWRSYRGKRVTVQVSDLDTSFATRRAPEVLPGLEQAVEELIKLLAPTKEQLEEPVQVYLVDPRAFGDAAELPQGAENDIRKASGTGTDAIVYVMRPEEHHEQLLLAVTRALVKRWLGENALSTPFFLNGIAGIIAACSGMREKRWRYRYFLSLIPT